MPSLVRVASGDNPRVIEENISDADAHTLAQRVSANTGETVQIVPYVYDEAAGEWKLGGKPSAEITVTPEPEAVADVVNLDELDTEALDHLAIDNAVADWDPGADIEEKRALLSVTLGIPRVGDPVVLESLKGAELDKLAAEKNVEGYKKSAPVAERRSFLARVLRGGS